MGIRIPCLYFMDPLSKSCIPHIFGLDYRNGVLVHRCYKIKWWSAYWMVQSFQTDLLFLVNFDHLTAGDQLFYKESASVNNYFWSFLFLLTHRLHALLLRPHKNVF
ncbi:uncharacterized protein LOC117919940 [Vitis riparia]|uniref:uncharacterized protein LOC117919940 n=1 Tax=Vitis riparia TaxID=96939 RepID=UPI00155A6B9F|nr:uncharacterized protein LOC117919940 [Vitis riparia]